MVHSHYNRLRLITMILITFSSDQYLALTLCPTAVWQRSAITVAGSPQGASGSDASSLSVPLDVYVVNDSMIYVLDAGNARVQRVASNSTAGVSVIGGTSTVNVTELMSMIDMSVDRNGVIYILDRLDNKIVKWTPGNSTFTIVAGGNGPGNNVTQLDWPSGMFVEPTTSAIWIADTDNHRVVQWTSPTTSVVVCGGFGSDNNELMYPFGLFVDTSDSNTLYVTDTGNHRVQMWQAGATSGVTVAGITNYYGNGLNQLWSPMALVVDTNRNMFIVDYDNSRILKWTIGASVGVIIARNSAAGVRSNQLYLPTRIDFDSSGSLYVADTDNHRVQKFVVSCPAVVNTSTTAPSSVTTTPSSNTDCAMTTYASNATTIAGSEIGWNGETSAALSSPIDTVVDRNGILYVADANNFRVQRFYPNSTNGTTVVYGNEGSLLNQFGYLDALHVDASGNIFILDSVNSRVVKWAPAATSGIVAAGNRGAGAGVSQLNQPYGFFVDPITSVIWIADTGNNRIVRWDSSTTGILVCGSSGSGAHQFSEPFGLFVDTSASNTLYVADTSNHRIQKWLSGATSGTTVAGQTGTCSSALDRLCYPSAVIKDQNGFIYIADTANGRIVRWLAGATTGTVVAGDTSVGVLPNQLNGPFSIKLDPEGALIVADTRNNRIQRFAVACAATTSSSTSVSMSHSSTLSPTPTISGSRAMMMTTTQSSSLSAPAKEAPLALLTMLASLIILMQN